MLFIILSNLGSALRDAVLYSIPLLFINLKTNKIMKQETTFEKVIEDIQIALQCASDEAFLAGAKWQKKQDKNKYSEEDMAKAFDEGVAYETQGKLIRGKEWIKTHKKDWFEQFKKK